MAQRTILIDDIDGSENDVKTVQFGIDTANYEIDLSPENHAILKESLADFIKSARKRSRSTTGTSGKRAGADYDVREVRAWARDNNIEVPDRGRIKAEVVEQWKAATGK